MLEIRVAKGKGEDVGAVGYDGTEGKIEAKDSRVMDKANLEPNVTPL